jgi:hypothetical protein
MRSVAASPIRRGLGSFEALGVELVEADAVGLVGDEEVEHGLDGREAAGLTREAADHLDASLGALGHHRPSPPAAAPPIARATDQVVAHWKLGASSARVVPTAEIRPVQQLRGR